MVEVESNKGEQGEIGKAQSFAEIYEVLDSIAEIADDKSDKMYNAAELKGHIQELERLALSGNPNEKEVNRIFKEHIPNAHEIKKTVNQIYEEVKKQTESKEPEKTVDAKFAELYLVLQPILRVVGNTDVYSGARLIVLIDGARKAAKDLVRTHPPGEGGSIDGLISIACKDITNAEIPGIGKLRRYVKALIKEENEKE